jgi:hypothetical protein
MTVCGTIRYPNPRLTWPCPCGLKHDGQPELISVGVGVRSEGRWPRKVRLVDIVTDYTAGHGVYRGGDVFECAQCEAAALVSAHYAEYVDG